MTDTKIGISDISIFIPDQIMPLQTILEQRTREDEKWQRRLSRAIQITGQESFRFPSPWEDTTTMAAQACHSLLKNRSPEERKQVRYLTIGTETSIDFSKPASSYVLGMMDKAMTPLSPFLSTFQLQHACAGATLGLLSICGLLSSAGQPGDKGVALSSDISRYEAPSTAEITQGAGATALLVEQDPRLIELDLPSLGVYSKDVDDFFRPLYSVTAMVKGRYSSLCYNENLIGAFSDHCHRAGLDPVEELKSIDIFSLHVPYSQMPYNALQKLFEKYLDYNEEQTRAYLQDKGFFSSIEPARTIGNIYTGSLFLSLAFSLRERHQTLGQDIVGKKILLASYGSGSTMALITGKIAAGAPDVINNWDLDQAFSHIRDVEFPVYQHWLDNGKPGPLFSQKENVDNIPAGRFYLEKIREDGYREYNIR